MAINIEKKICTFGDLPVGEIFMFPNKDELFMRTQNLKTSDIKCYNAVSLKTGEIFEFSYCYKVRLCKVTIACLCSEMRPTQK